MKPATLAGEGCGNTFLLARAEELRAGGADQAAWPALARRLCGPERDGLLVVGPRGADGAVAARILNRDGSEGGTCLNGLRVAACADGGAAGVFRMDGRLVPWRRLGAGEFELELGALDGVRLRKAAVAGRAGLAVDFWNPHAVFAAEDLEAFPLATFAARCDERKDLFPAGVNVEIIQRSGPAALRARVRERGVGETRACGSGAVAIALAEWAGGAPAALEVRMPGGALRLERRGGGSVFLAGAASVNPLQEEA